MVVSTAVLFSSNQSVSRSVSLSVCQAVGQLAAVTTVSERLSLAQRGAASTEHRAVSGYLRGYRRPAVLRVEGLVILLTKPLIRNRAPSCRRMK